MSTIADSFVDNNTTLNPSSSHVLEFDNLESSNSDSPPQTSHLNISSHSPPPLESDPLSSPSYDGPSLGQNFPQSSNFRHSSSSKQSKQNFLSPPRSRKPKRSFDDTDALKYRQSQQRAYQNQPLSARKQAAPSFNEIQLEPLTPLRKPRIGFFSFFSKHSRSTGNLNQVKDSDSTNPKSSSSSNATDFNTKSGTSVQETPVVAKEPKRKKLMRKVSEKNLNPFKFLSPRSSSKNSAVTTSSSSSTSTSTSTSNTDNQNPIPSSSKDPIISTRLPPNSHQSQAEKDFLSPPDMSKNPLKLPFLPTNNLDEQPSTSPKPSSSSELTSPSASSNKTSMFSKVKGFLSPRAGKSGGDPKSDDIVSLDIASPRSQARNVKILLSRPPDSQLPGYSNKIIRNQLIARDKLEQQISKLEVEDGSFVTQLLVQELEDILNSSISNLRYPINLSLNHPQFSLESLHFLNYCPNVFKDIDLGGNALIDIENLDGLSKLKRLKLNSNRITSFSLNLPNLEILSLASNRLRQLYDLKNCKKLVYLDIRDNQIRSGWNQIALLKHLQYLDLGLNRLSYTLLEFDSKILTHVAKCYKLIHFNCLPIKLERYVPDFFFFLVWKLPHVKFINFIPVDKASKRKAKQLSQEGHWDQLLANDPQATGLAMIRAKKFSAGKNSISRGMHPEGMKTNPKNIFLQFAKNNRRVRTPTFSTGYSSPSQRAKILNKKRSLDSSSTKNSSLQEGESSSNQTPKAKKIGRTPSLRRSLFGKPKRSHFKSDSDSNLADLISLTPDPDDLLSGADRKNLIDTFGSRRSLDMDNGSDTDRNRKYSFRRLTSSTSKTRKIFGSVSSQTSASHQTSTPEKRITSLSFPDFQDLDILELIPLFGSEIDSSKTAKVRSLLSMQIRHVSQNLPEFDWELDQVEKLDHTLALIVPRQKVDISKAHQKLLEESNPKLKGKIENVFQVISTLPANQSDIWTFLDSILSQTRKIVSDPNLSLPTVDTAISFLSQGKSAEVSSKVSGSTETLSQNADSTLQSGSIDTTISTSDTETIVSLKKRIAELETEATDTNDQLYILQKQNDNLLGKGKAGKLLGIGVASKIAPVPAPASANQGKLSKFVEKLGPSSSVTTSPPPIPSTSSIPEPPPPPKAPAPPPNPFPSTSSIPAPPPPPGGPPAPPRIPGAPAPPAAPSVPGAPPPPSGLFGGLFGSSKPKGRKPKKKLKKLFWQPTRLNNSEFSSSIFSKIAKPEDVIIDYPLIETVFAAKASKKAAGADTQEKHSNPVKKKKVIANLLDPKRGRQVGIIANQYSKKKKWPDYESLSHALNTADMTKLSLNDVINIEKCIPNKQDIEALKSFKGPSKTLGQAEQFQLALQEIPKLELRLKILKFCFEYNSRFDSLTENLNQIISACNQILHSQHLLRLVEYVLKLGNFMNHGTNRSGLKSFHYSFLTKLATTKSTDNKTTLLRFILSHLQMADGEANLIVADLDRLENASRHNPTQILSDLQSLQSEFKMVDANMKEFKNRKQKAFKQVISQNLSVSRTLLENTTSLATKMRDIMNETASYLGENPKSKKFDPYEMLVNLNTFRKQCQAAVKANRAAIEKKRKAAANAQKSKAKRRRQRAITAAPKELVDNVKSLKSMKDPVARVF